MSLKERVIPRNGKDWLILAGIVLMVIVWTAMGFDNPWSIAYNLAAGVIGFALGRISRIRERKASFGPGTSANSTLGRARPGPDFEGPRRR